MLKLLGSRLRGNDKSVPYLFFTKTSIGKKPTFFSSTNLHNFPVKAYNKKGAPPIVLFVHSL
jgi:hypothetical protein